MNTVFQFPYSAQRGRFLVTDQTMAPLGLGGFLISPQMLRVVQVVSATATRYSFDLKSNGQLNRADEIKLSQNDGFVVFGIGLGIQKSTIGSEGKTPVWTWPNLNIFTAANEATALEQFWQGSLSFKTEPTTRVPSIHTSLMRYDPGQLQDAVPPAVTVAQAGPNWGPGMAERGIYEYEPGLILDGFMQNTVELLLGPGDPVAGAAATNLVVLSLLGYLVANGGGKLGSFYVNR